MTYPTDYPDWDEGVTDPLESRQFYELCQQYRHSVIAVKEFEALKDWIRVAMNPPRPDAGND